MVIKYIRKLLGRKKVPSAEAKAPEAAAVRQRQPEVHHRPIPPNLIDPDAAKIVKRLRRFGHTAYIVGGGVRDLLLQRTPKDFDIGTSARPNEVRKLFRNCRIIGRRFRLAHIYFHDKIIEVATFRSNQPEDLAAAEQAAAAEAAETPARGPEGGRGHHGRRGGGRSHEPAAEASAGGSPQEKDFLIRSDNVFGTPETDALRRDFTINALFYDTETGDVIDYVGGIADLDAGLLRMIGDPDVRLREDPIRILRAVRLAGRLGFTIHHDTLAAIRRHKGDVRLAAPPRVLEDLLRMFRKGGAETAMSLMHEVGVDEVVMPELLAAAHPGDYELQLKTFRSLDLATERGTEFSNATLLSLIFYPYVRRAISSHDLEGGAQAFNAIDRIVGPFEQRLIVPKKERERIRQILLAQKRFTQASHPKRFSTGTFIRKPFFPEAFDLFDIISSATGEHREEVRRWKSRISSVAMDTDGESLGPKIPLHAGHGQGQGRGGGGGAGGGEGDRAGKRRRRGGRGRGHQGTGSGDLSIHGGSRAAAGHQRTAHEFRHEEPEPFVLPELAPGENPYGDAIAVPIPAGPSSLRPPRSASPHGRQAALDSARGWTDPGGEPAESGSLEAGANGEHAPGSAGNGHAVAPSGQGGHRGQSGHSGGAGDANGKRRRRRRGGRGRRSGGGHASGGAPSGNPSSDL